MSFGSTPLSTTTIGSNQFPVSAVYVPGTSGGNLTAMQGGPASTDGNGNASAPGAIYVADGSDVTQGTSTDAAGANSVIGQLKQIRLNTASVTIGGGTVAASQSGSWTVSGSGNFNNASVGTTAAAVPASATYMGGNKSGNLVGLALDSSGNLNVNVAAGGASGGTSSSYGSAFPATGTAIGASDGTNMQGLLVESSSNKNLRVGIYSGANEVTVTGANALKVDGSAVTQPVSGTFWQATQPVSGTITANIGTSGSLALDATVAKLTVAQSAALGSNTGPMIQGSVTTASPSYTTGNINPISLTTAGALRVDASATTQPVSGTFWQATQPISAASLPLPSGAATSAKQPALGTAGSASSDVITVQGIASMTALKVDGSGVTQPVSGTFWQATQPISGTITANAGTNLNTSALALDTSVNGILLSQASTTSGQKGALVQGATTTNAPSYTTAQTNPISLDTSGLLRVSLKDTPANTNNFNVALAASSATVTVTATNLQTNINQIAGATVATAATGIMKVGLTDGSGTAITSTSNAIDVNIKSGGGSGFSVVDEVAWTAGTSAFVPTGGVYNDSATALTSGQEGAVRLTNNRAIHANLRDASGNQLLGSKTSANSIPVVVASDQGAFPVSQSGTWNITNVSGTVSLPTGASTSAKQPALGTAGSASSDVITVQGIASMTALKVDGSGVTQPVSGTFWQATQPVSGTVSITANSSVNVAQVAGSNVSTAAAGVQKVGVVGNTGATLDSTVGAGTAPTNALAVASVYNSSAPTPTNGQAMALQADQAGNIRTFPGVALSTLSAWNSGTALNATQTIFTNSGAAAVLVQLTQTTTLTAGAVTFEVSYDGSTWNTIPANCVLDPASSTFAQISVPYTVQANTNKSFLLNMNGAQGLRTKLSTQITGSGTVTPNYALLPMSPADTVLALSPTAANFNVTVGGSLPAGSASLGTVGLNAGSNLVGGVYVYDSAGTNKLAVDGSGRVSVLGITNALPAGSNVIGSTTIQATSGTALQADQTNTILKTSLYVKKSANADTVLALGSATSANSVPVVVASDQGAFPVTQSGTWTVQPGNTANTTAWLTQPVAGTTGGSTSSHTMSAASTNATSLKASAGLLYGFSISNANTSARYFKLYNKASAPTVGTDTPVSTIQVPGSATVIRAYPVGLVFGTGIAWATTTGIADSDTGAVGANDLSIDLDYK